MTSEAQGEIPTLEPEMPDSTHYSPSEADGKSDWLKEREKKAIELLARERQKDMEIAAEQAIQNREKGPVNLEEAYGDELFAFAHSWEAQTGDPSTLTSEQFHLRKKEVDDQWRGRITELSIVDSNGERVGLFEGHWYKDEHGRQCFDNFESHNPDSPLRGIKVRENNRSLPRRVPRIVAHALVETVLNNQLTWSSSSALSNSGRDLYEHIDSDSSPYRSQVKVDRNPGKDTAAGRPTSYVVTPKGNVL